jgi:3-deoxy-manno-octulosonate cytidylyltransferase (CMP-KDO synthetase)
MRFIGVIPARFDSTRFPGKPLVEVAGKPLVQWVYERASRAGYLEEVLVATDDERIEQAVQKFGGRVRMTAKSHRSGTERIVEVAAGIDAEVFINIQGDEPLMAPSTIEAVCRCLSEDRELEVATARIPLDSAEAARDPNTVKVVTDQAGRALYFSRSPIPYHRQGTALFHKHIGIYGYRRSLLLRLANLQPSPLESAECLEQLRFLENGIVVKVATVREDSIGVDVPEDLERVRPLLQNLNDTTYANQKPNER